MECYVAGNLAFAQDKVKGIAHIRLRRKELTKRWKSLPQADREQCHLLCVSSCLTLEVFMNLAMASCCGSCCSALIGTSVP